MISLPNSASRQPKWIHAAIAGLSLLIAHQSVWGASTTARKGEGIYQLLERNGLSRDTHFETFIKLNESTLGPGNTLYQGREYALPSKGHSIFTEPLFGPEHQDVRIVDQALSGAVFYLVSGHGGPDPGAVGKVSGRIVTEDEYAYDVTLRLGRRLISHGAKVHFIIRDPSVGIRAGRFLKHNKTEVCYPNLKIPINQRARLKQRADAVNALYRKTPQNAYARCLVIHIDGRSRNQDIDVFFYHHKSSENGKRLASSLRDTLKAKYKQAQPNRVYEGTVSHRNLYMIDHTVPPVVFMELGNIHNERDQKRILQAGNREALANWLCQGVLADYRKG